MTDETKDRVMASWLKTCVHFDGVQNGKCKVGVPYNNFQDTTGKLIGLLPCLIHNGTAPDTCRLREYPSREKVEAELVEMEEQCEKVTRAMKAARDVANAAGHRRGSGGRGSLKCPACEDGTLRYSVAGVNGHLWGKCSTEGCVKWMQ